MQESDLKRPVFRIIPDKFALEPFESCVITLEGSSNESVNVYTISYVIPISPILISVHSYSKITDIHVLYCTRYIVFSRPSSVSERLICHAIIGKNAHKERIMTVDVTANFIAPLTQFSTRELTFTTYQVS